MAYFSDHDYKRFGQKFMEDIIEWVKSNVGPSDVYDDDALILAIENICKDSPEKVFSDEVLGAWAEENGYTKQE